MIPVHRLVATAGSGLIGFALAVFLLALPACSSSKEERAPSAAVQTAMTAGPSSTTARIVLVEWRIKKGREQEFLDYWSNRAPIGDRSGLMGEFLARVEDPEKFPWTQWRLDPSWTTFVNVGFWRASSDFQQQIGRFIDLSRPPLDFEAQSRSRVIMAPERWRIGATPFITADHPEAR